MRGRVGLPRLRWPRRADIAAAVVVALFVFSIIVIAVGTFVAHDLRPTGSMFGLPGRLSFPLCGRSYLLSNTGGWSKADVEASLVPDEEGVLLEPKTVQD